MKQIKVNPNNEQYYSKEFVRGFNLGAERQYEADIADMPTWIPCSERLPKDEGIFLVTMETYVFNEYSHPVGTSFYSPSFGWVNASPNEVLAWMPLPDPWKGTNYEQMDIDKK